jgi:hypothetical protein
MRAGATFAIVTAVVAVAVIIVARLCHSHVLWADDNLPLATAIELARGKTLYRDVWFDKPPLVAWIALLWGARAGIALRLAGAAYVIAAAAVAWQFARSKWSEREGLLAAFLIAFFLTFDLPSAVIPLASDMLLILPHLLAIYFAWRQRAFLSGLAAGIGLLCSSKAVFVLAACALWQFTGAPSFVATRATPRGTIDDANDGPAARCALLIAGFLAPNVIAIGWMWLHGSAAEYYRQVWQWGSIYAANTFVANPLTEGVKRTLDWLGFHAALVVGTILAVAHDRKWRPVLWLAIAFAGVIVGLRFFPRYYFLLLPPMTIAAARGGTIVAHRPMQLVEPRSALPSIDVGQRRALPPVDPPDIDQRHALSSVDPPEVDRHALPSSLAILALIALLAIPFIRFAPGDVRLGRGETSSDLAIDRDSQQAAEKLRVLAHLSPTPASDTLFVWGFRPDIFIYSHLPAGTRFLESQPISGVLADRHLFSNVAVAPEFVAPNRAELVQSRPTFLVDGLGVYNPSLALVNQSYLAAWLQNYREVDRTAFSIIYRLR